MKLLNSTFWFGLLLLFPSGVIRGQSDSLQIACDMLQSDTSRINCLIDANGSFLSSDPMRALQYGQLALSVAEKTGLPEYKVRSLKAVALAHGYNSDPENSKPHYLEAISVLEAMGDKQRQGNMYLNLGADYEFVRQLDSTMFYFLKALELYEESGDELGVSKVQNNLAIVYRRMGYYIMAIESYEKSLAHKAAVGNDEGVMNTYLNMSAMYYQMNAFDSARKFGQLSIDFAQRLDDRYTEGLALLNLCLVESDLDNLPKALSYGRASQLLLEEVGDERRLCQLYSNLAYIYARFEKCDSAMHYLKTTCSQGPFTTSNILKIRNLVEAMCQEQSGDYESAYFAMKNYAAYADTVYSEEQKTGLAEMSYKYQQEVVRSQVLEKEKALSVSEADRSRLLSIVLAISSLAAILILIILIVNVRAKRRRERDQAELQQQVSKIDLLQQKLATLADAPLPEVAMSLNAKEVNELLVNPLTERELEVLSMIATGKSNQQIADESFVSINTIKTHIHRIYDKLDVKNRTEATLKASSLNLIKK